MKKYFEKYFGNNLSEDVRMFNLASSLGAFFTLLFILTGILIRYNPLILVILFACCSVSFFLLIRENRHSSIVAHKYILLIMSGYFCFPLCLCLTEKNNAELPIYFLIPVTFGLVLLKGVHRLIYTVVLIMIDVLTMHYAFIVRVPYDKYYSSLGNEEYIRLEFAIIATGVICGLLILYRNYLIHSEIAEREKAGSQAEKASLAKDMFLVNVSHEIRTPLNAIIGTTDVLLDSEVSGHIKEMAYNISNSSHALLSITTDLLDFSRMNNDSLSPNEDKYDIALMMRDVINLMNVRLLDSNVSFYVDINPFLPRILVGDSGKIRQILVNMLSNSIKYTPAGHMIFRVNFDYEGRDFVRLHIEVEDTGIGIKPDMIEKIFEAYNRSGVSDTDHEIEGNGLGLALCKRLARAMGGEIWAESEYGKGSVFHFEVVQALDIPYTGGYCGGLKSDVAGVCFYSGGNKETKQLDNIFSSMEIPFKEAFSAEEFIEECKADKREYYMLGSELYEDLKEEINSTGVDWGKIVVVSPCNNSFTGEPFKYVLTTPVSCLNVADLLNHTSNYEVRKNSYNGEFSIPDTTILIIDDNLVNLEVASSILSKYKARVLTAASGREGIICLEQEHVDIVFLDYMMPDMDGIDTLKEIRKLPDDVFKTLPVITLTANVVSGAKEMFLEAGFDAYLSKPIEVERLEKVLFEFLPSSKFKFTI